MASESTRAIYVLTGGPCAGKTTLLEALLGRGFPVLHEAAAEVILEGALRPGEDAARFQEEVLRRQLSKERAAPPGVVFADRGVGDHFGYLDHYRAVRGLDLEGSLFKEALERAWAEALPRYRAVFVLEQSPLFVATAVRRETGAEAAAIHRAIVAAYRSRHPRVIEVPFVPVEDRVEAVLRAVEAGAR
jgi:predicted ATPase